MLNTIITALPESASLEQIEETVELYVDTHKEEWVQKILDTNYQLRRDLLVALINNGYNADTGTLDSIIELVST